jgi:hypothetical protein
MFDSFSNLIIVLIPLAIFIGRIVLQAQSKRKPQPPVRQPPIPVHFEDYDDEDDRQFAPSAVLRTAVNHKDREDTYNPSLLIDTMDSASKPPKNAKTLSAEPAQSVQSVQSARSAHSAHGGFSLNHLSPMKQAVVMAEVLGLPKGIQ